MEDRGKEVVPRTPSGEGLVAVRRGRRGRGEVLLLALVPLAFVVPTVALARSLDQQIPNLYGGTLAVTIDPFAQQDLREVGVAERFKGLSASLAAARSQAPIPSASGAFRFAWDPELDTFVRHKQSLGSTVAERARTLGRKVFTFGISYTRIDFDTLDGDDLSNITALEPALSEEYLSQLPPADQVIFADDLLETQLNLKFGYDLFFLTAAYGITDRIDVSFALAINRARMRGRSQATILDPQQNGSAVFAFDQQGVVTDGSVEGCEMPFICAVDGFDDSVWGTGDLYLRGKWHFAELRWVDLAGAGVLTLPTGNADDLLGFHDPTFTPWLIGSKTFGWLEPHVNLGYSIRSSDDVGQARWIAGTDLIAAEWLSLSVDFLGYHDSKRDDVNDNVFQSALGFKLNPLKQLILGASFQLPLNDDGIRADVIYTGQIEYTF
jgi:hypothetical protein